MKDHKGIVMQKWQKFWEKNKNILRLNMQVIYNFGLAKQNQLYKPSALTNAPTIKANCPGKCTLVMYDPDAVHGTFLHWVVEDFFGEKKKVLPYYGPHPPKGTDIHRYIFAFYPNLSLKIESREIPNINTIVGNQNPLQTFQILSTFSPSGGTRKHKRKRKIKKRKTKRR